MQNPREKRGLGRGVSALMADVGASTPSEATGRQPRADRLVSIAVIEPNPDQPRRTFGEDALKDLAASLAQLHEVPVVVREFSDTETIEVAIIENIQRADLNAIEEAAGYRQLMDKFGHTQEKLAEALSKSRSHIANLLRLLQLPPDVQDLVQTGKLSAGHARTLVTAENPSEIARQILAKGLSVRQAEALAKSGVAHKAKGNRTAPEKDADTRALEGDLSAQLKMKVSIDPNPGDEAGTLTIRYKNLDDLDLLCQALSNNT